MPDREAIERLLADLGRRREEARAEAAHAADRLTRLAGGLTPVSEVPPEQVRAAADTFVEARLRLGHLDETARNLRGLLM